MKLFTRLRNSNFLKEKKWKSFWKYLPGVSNGFIRNFTEVLRRPLKEFMGKHQKWFANKNSGKVTFILKYSEFVGNLSHLSRLDRNSPVSKLSVDISVYLRSKIKLKKHNTNYQHLWAKTLFITDNREEWILQEDSGCT